jgi:hypothetical protein
VQPKTYCIRAGRTEAIPGLLFGRIGGENGAEMKETGQFGSPDG